MRAISSYPTHVKNVATFIALPHYRCMKAPKSVNPDQFARVGINATHLPTFAAFTLTERGVLCTNWGLVGVTPGAEYDPAEIKTAAIALLHASSHGRSGLA
jgi:hypothetical protein